MIHKYDTGVYISKGGIKKMNNRSMMWRQPRLLLCSCLSLFLFVSLDVVDSCTMLICGKDASADGTVMVSHSNDGEFDTDPRLVKIPAADHPSGSMRPVFFSPEDYPRYLGTLRGDIPEYAPSNYDGNDEKVEEMVPIGYIPQVEHTYAYLEQTYGAINEMDVGIGESTCSGIFGAIPLGVPNGTALLSVDELSQIAMERASSSREAIKIMGALAVEYGFYGAGSFEGTSESLGVTDPNEAWIFQVMPDPTGRSAIWVAQRVADDSFVAIANMFVVRQVDPNDTDNFLMSDSVHEVALEYGWWDPESDDLLDFTKIYSDGEYDHKFYSGRRMWGAYHLAAPSKQFSPDYVDLQSDPVYPVYVKPDKPLTLQDLFRIHRYYYQDTPFDLGAPGNMAGGPFGTPDRWKPGKGELEVPGHWERAIGLYRTSDTYVVQSKKGSADSVLWFGPASALGTVFTPFVVGLSEIPSSFRSGHHSKFSRESAFWAACYVANVANLKWSYAINDITKLQLELESASIVMVEAIEEKEDHRRKDNNTNELVSSSMEEAYLSNIESIVASLWSLSDQIVFKYASGFVNEPTLSGMVGYPAWWLKEVGFQDGPPSPPTKSKCCNPPKVNKNEEEQTTVKETQEHYLRKVVA